MNKYKTAVSIVLFAVIIVPFAFIVMYKLNQMELRNTMHTKLTQNYLQTIKVSKHNIKWVRIDEEILINGRLFDVQHIDVHSDSIYLTGLFDSDEDLLNNKLGIFIKGKHKGETPFNQWVFKFLGSLYALDESHFCIKSFLITDKLKWKIFDSSISSPSMLVHSPPPETV